VVFDKDNQRLLATSTDTGVIFESADAGRSWQRGPDSGYPLRHLDVIHGRILAATPFDGLIIEPEAPQRAGAGSN
jgi:hypothetical protein